FETRVSPREKREMVKMAATATAPPTPLVEAAVEVAPAMDPAGVAGAAAAILFAAAPAAREDAAAVKAKTMVRQAPQAHLMPRAARAARPAAAMAATAAG